MIFRLSRFALIRAATCLAGFAACLSSPAAWADNWTTIAAVPNTQVEVSIDETSIMRPHNVVTSWLQSLGADYPKDNLTHAWFLFDFPTPVTTAESFVYRSYKRREGIDCGLRASATEAYVAYSDPRADGRVIYTWTGPNAVAPTLVPATPGSISAIMIDAACAPPRPQAQVAPESTAAPASTPVNNTTPNTVPPGAPLPANGTMAPHSATQTLQ